MGRATRRLGSVTEPTGWHPVTVGVALALLVSAGCERGRPAPEDWKTDQSHIHGVAFTPFTEPGESPEQGSVVSKARVEEWLGRIAGRARWVRTFGCGSGLDQVGTVGHRLGLRVAMGAWVGPDPEANRAELDCLVAAARRGDVDLAIVGSEVLLRQDLPPAELVALMGELRSDVPAVAVTTSDTAGALLAHPEVIQAATGPVMTTIYPFWEGVPIDRALASFAATFGRLREVTTGVGKELIVGETGWPSAGEPVGEAVPSLENAARYFLEFETWSRTNGVGSFYFAMADELWKAESTVGPHWGIWDRFGSMKPGFDRAFSVAIGLSVPPSSSPAAVVSTVTSPSTSVVFGPAEAAGAARIEPVLVPSLGSFEPLRGRVVGVDPAAVVVAAYIHVGALGWYSKPFSHDRVTAVPADGSFEIDVTTGGQDERADVIALFLLPSGTEPPIALGAPALSEELRERALAWFEVARSP